MPEWLQTFAENQPLTRVCDAVRGLMLASSTADVVPAVLWIIAILGVFAPTAVVLYRRT